MAGRKKKNTVDYFPHYIGEGKKIQFIEAKYGNDGYATWFKILESLATTPDHYIDLNTEMEIVFLSSKCKVDEVRLTQIIDDLSMLGSIDKQLWERKIIWSEVFIESIKDTYKKRTTFSLSFIDLWEHLFGPEKCPKTKSDTEIQNKIISDAEIDKSDAEIDISGGINGEIRKEEKKRIRKEEKYSEIEISAEEMKSNFEVQKARTKLPWEQYSALDFDTPKSDLLQDIEFIGRTASDHAISQNDAIDWITRFFEHISKTQEGHTNIKGYRSHCTNWINFRIQNQQKNYANGNQPNFKPGQRTNGRAPQGGYGTL